MPAGGRDGKDDSRAHGGRRAAVCTGGLAGGRAAGIGPGGLDRGVAAGRPFGPGASSISTLGESRQAKADRMSQRDDKDRAARPNVRPETAAEQQAREQRLAQQLRANLRKRKRQQRGRGAGTGGEAPDGDTGGEGPDER
jgi:hypothetical protein